MAPGVGPKIDTIGGQVTAPDGTAATPTVPHDGAIPEPAGAAAKTDKFVHVDTQPESAPAADVAAALARSAKPFGLGGGATPPTTEIVDQYNFEKLSGVPLFRPYLYHSLSNSAKRGVYLLLSRQIPPAKINEFMANPALESVGGPGEVLELVALMYEYNVRGFEQAFVPTERDDKYLSGDKSRIVSMHIEHTEALRQAANTDAQGVSVDERLSIDWSALTEKDAAFLSLYVIPNLPEGLKSQWRHQTQVEVDAMVTAPAGKRLMEVKSSRGRFSPRPEELAKILLQVFRHALVVRRQQLAGIDYVIRAREVDGSFLSNLKGALDATGVRYIVRIEGGKDKRSIDGGLSFEMRDQEIKRPFTRPLPLVPQPKAKGRTQSEGKEDVSTDKSPWTTQMKNWLDHIIESSDVEARRCKNSDELVRALQAIPRRDAKELVRQISDRLKNEAVSDYWRTLKPLVDNFATRAESAQGLSRPAIRLLIQMAAIASNAEEAVVSTEETKTKVAEDYLQGLAIRKYEMERVLQEYLDATVENLDTASGMLRDTKTDEELTFLRSEVAEVLEGVVSGLDSQRPLTLAGILALMEQTKGELDWNLSLAKRARKTLEVARSLVADIDKRRTELPARKPEKVAEIYKPLSNVDVDGLRQKVLDLGELPELIRTLKKKSAAKSRETLIYDEGRALDIYKTLILYKPETEGNSRYYFPDDLKNVELRVIGYLGQCGIGEVEREERLSALRIKAFQAMMGMDIQVTSIDSIITPEFVRTDLVDAHSALTGEKKDVTAIVARLMREEREKVKDYIRIIVMKKGRKVYFVNWAKLSESGYDLRYPTYGELEEIMRDEGAAKKLFEMLGANEEKWAGKDEFVFVGTVRDGKALNLNLLEKSEAERLKPHRFQLSFQKRGDGHWRLAAAKGANVLNLAIAYIEAISGKKIEGPVEKILIGRWLGPKAQAKDGENLLRLDDVKVYLSKPGAIEELAELYHVVNDKFIPDVFVITGVPRADRTIESLNLTTPDKARGLASMHFQLQFQKLRDGWRLTAAKGTSSLNLAIATVENALGNKIEDPVEKALLAGYLRGNVRTQEGGNSLSSENFRDYLSKPNLKGRLEKLYLVAKGEPLPDRFVISGIFMANGGIECFELETQDEFEKSGGRDSHYFKLHFGSQEDHSLQLIEASGKGALDSAIAVIEGVLDRKIDSRMESSLLARWLGTKPSAKEGGHYLTVGDVRTQLQIPDVFERLNFIYLLLKGENLPATFVITGISDARGSVTALNLVSPDAAAGLSDHNYFKIPVEQTANGYRIAMPTEPSAATRRLLEGAKTHPPSKKSERGFVVLPEPAARAAKSVSNKFPAAGEAADAFIARIEKLLEVFRGNPDETAKKVSRTLARDALSMTGKDRERTIAASFVLGFGKAGLEFLLADAGRTVFEDGFAGLAEVASKLGSMGETHAWMYFGGAGTGATVDAVMSSMPRLKSLSPAMNMLIKPWLGLVVGSALDEFAKTGRIDLLVQARTAVQFKAAGLLVMPLRMAAKMAGVGSGFAGILTSAAFLAVELTMVKCYNETMGKRGPVLSVVQSANAFAESVRPYPYPKLSKEETEGRAKKLGEDLQMYAITLGLFGEISELDLAAAEGGKVVISYAGERRGKSVLDNAFKLIDYHPDEYEPKERNFAFGERIRAEAGEAIAEGLSIYTGSDSGRDGGAVKPDDSFVQKEKAELQQITTDERLQVVETRIDTLELMKISLVRRMRAGKISKLKYELDSFAVDREVSLARAERDFLQELKDKGVQTEGVYAALEVFRMALSALRADWSKKEEELIAGLISQNSEWIDEFFAKASRDHRIIRWDSVHLARLSNYAEAVSKSFPTEPEKLYLLGQALERRYAARNGDEEKSAPAPVVAATG